MLRSYFPAYFAKKGENLATKEDIAGITGEVEKVRSQYNVLIEELKARHQLKLAALPERLKAHQEAFAFWRTLVITVHRNNSEEIGAHIARCEEWWDNNCLYLNAEAREAFSRALWSAQQLRPEACAKQDGKRQSDNWERLSHAGDVLVRSVELPSLGADESLRIAND